MVLLPVYGPITSTSGPSFLSDVEIIVYSIKVRIRKEIIDYKHA